MKKFEEMLDWVARVYVNALNIIHHMHDKYSYEAYKKEYKNKVTY